MSGLAEGKRSGWFMPEGISARSAKVQAFLARRSAWVVFCFLALAYAYFYHEPGFNGNSRLALTAAIVQEGRLTIDSFHADSGFATGDKSVYNGHYYSDKAIGASLLAVIPYAPLYWDAALLGKTIGPWLAAHILTLLVIGLPSALAGALIYQVCARISGSLLRAGLVTAAAALGTLAYPFSLVFFSHQLAAALLWISFFLIFRLRDQDGAPRSGYALLCGFLPGLAFITEYTTGVIILPLAAYYLYVLWTRRAKAGPGSLLFAALGGLLPLLLLMGYNWLVFGQPLANSYQFLADKNYLEAMSHGIMGIGWPNLTVLFYMTLQPAMGLFWQSPVLLLALPGAYFILRERRWRVEGGLALLIFAAYLLVCSGYFQWWGGYSAGVRHLVPMLPFLSLLLIRLPRRFTPWLAGLALVSAAQMVVIAASGVVVPNEAMNDFARLGFFEYSVIYSYSLPQLLQGHFTWNLGSDLLGLGGWASLIPLLLAAGGMFGVLGWARE